MRCGGMSCSVVNRMCYTYACGPCWSYASGVMRRSRRALMDLMEEIGATR